MISAYDWSLKFITHKPDALGRTGIVSNDIARADPIGDPLCGGIVQHDAHRIDVGVDIAQYTVNLSHLSKLEYCRRDLKVFGCGYLDVGFVAFADFHRLAGDFDGLRIIEHFLALRLDCSIRLAKH